MFQAFSAGSLGQAIVQAGGRKFQPGSFCETWSGKAETHEEISEAGVSEWFPQFEHIWTEVEGERGRAKKIMVVVYEDAASC